jgi:hypothetical protein
MKWFSVTLLKEHAHAGVKYAKGDVVKVKQHVHDWLVKQGIVKETRPDADAPAAIAAPSTSSAPSKTVPAAAADQESSK